MVLLSGEARDRTLMPEVLGQEKRCLLQHRWLLWRVHLGKEKCVLQSELAWLDGGLHGLYWWPGSVASSSMKLEGSPRTMAKPEVDVSLRGQLYPYYAPNQLINRCQFLCLRNVV